MIQRCRKQIESKEDYKLELVMVMVSASQCRFAMVELKAQQLIMNLKKQACRFT